MVFDKLYQISLDQALAQDNASLVALDSQWADVQQGELRLRTRLIQLGQHAQARGVYIHAPKIEIVNLFLFPQAQGPGYALEFVVLGGKPVVAVMDMPVLDDLPATQHQAQAWMAQAHALYPVANSEHPPAWYAQCRSGMDFFLRPQTLETFILLTEVHDFLWARLLSYPFTPGAQPTLGWSAYKTHHCQHSPGRALLVKTFGTQWTEYFLRQVLFGD